MNGKELHRISPDDLLPGDVLLCRNLRPNALQRKISEETGSVYTHAAIVTDAQKICDATKFRGIKERPLQDLLREVDYVVALRCSLGWSPEGVRRLRDFVAGLQRLGMKYNVVGLIGFSKRRLAHAEKDVLEEIRKYFDDPHPELPETVRDHFCSELVVDCFIYAGIIGFGVDKILDPKTTAPGDLTKDPVYGHVLGYLTVDENVVPPDDDPAYGMTKYYDVFPKPKIAPIPQRES